MLIVVDNRISKEAKKKLSRFGELLEIRTEGITYPAIFGHPDIFFCQAPGKLIVAPNLPAPCFEQLKKHNIDYITGELPVGPAYPSSARYNAVATSNYLIHNFRHTDPVITRTMKELIPVHIDQGYCRCNLLPLKDDHFITSDRGIYNILTRLQHGDNNKLVQSSKFKVQSSVFNVQSSKFKVQCCVEQALYVSPSEILLEGFPHGFFGGCCGVWDDIVFINGSLRFFKDGDKVRNFLNNLNYKILELNIGPLVDIGSIFFI